MGNATTSYTTASVGRRPHRRLWRRSGVAAAWRKNRSKVYMRHAPRFAEAPRTTRQANPAIDRMASCRI